MTAISEMDDTMVKLTFFYKLTMVIRWVHGMQPWAMLQCVCVTVPTRLAADVTC